MLSEVVRSECIRLRVEGRMSTAFIHRKTGVSLSTLKGWLRDHPLDPEELLSHKREHVELLATQKRKPRGEESRLYLLTERSGLDSSQRGNLAEAVVLVRLIASGYKPFRAVFEGAKSDWVVVKGTKTVRVQVKLAIPGSAGLPTVSVRSASRKIPYKEGELDVLVGYDLYTDTCYVWTWSEIRGVKAAVSICSEAEERWDKISSA